MNRTVVVARDEPLEHRIPKAHPFADRKDVKLVRYVPKPRVDVPEPALATPVTRTEPARAVPAQETPTRAPAPQPAPVRAEPARSEPTRAKPPRIEPEDVSDITHTRRTSPAQPRFEFTHERVAWLQARRVEKKRARMERMQAERAPLLARAEKQRALRASVRARYDAGETQEAIARDIGLSRARVGQMLAEELAERENGTSAGER